MKTKIILLTGILIALIGILIFLTFKLSTPALTGEAVSKLDNYSYTKAICDGNSCVDYEIACNGSELVDMKPVTGAVVLPSDWEDPRDEEMKNKLCG